MVSAQQPCFMLIKNVDFILYCLLYYVCCAVLQINQMDSYRMDKVCDDVLQRQIEGTHLSYI